VITYRYDTNSLTIEEKQNEQDIEFIIKIKDADAVIPALRNVRAFFDSDKVYTDVIFYPHSNHEYQIIVRQDYYVDFLLALFKHRIIHAMEWNRVGRGD
jgi:predicted Zn-dependent protease